MDKANEIFCSMCQLNILFSRVEVRAMLGQAQGLARRGQRRQRTSQESFSTDAKKQKTSVTR